LALACDIRLASDSAVFSIPEVVFGLVPDCGGTQRLPRLVGPAMARELIFTGRRISAAEALRIGLVNHIYAFDQLIIEAEKMASEIAANPFEAVQASKRCLNMAMNSTLDAGLQFETASAETVLGEKVKTMLYTNNKL
jgi:enoyl-CoA hydratase